MCSVVLLCLTALCIFTLTTSHPLMKETIQTDSTRDNQSNTQAKISTYGYFLLMKLSNMMRKAINQEPNGADLLKNRSKDCSILQNIKNNNYICLDTTKKPQISVGAMKDCFKTGHRKKSPNGLCPWKHGDHKTRHRHRRNQQQFDPSDPLGSENPKSIAVNYRKPNREHERSSNVSKETITSCDDPLHVLLSRSPVSPNLKKEKKIRQVAPSDPF